MTKENGLTNLTNSDFRAKQELYNYIIDQAKDTQTENIKIGDVPVAMLYVDESYQRKITEKRWAKIRNMGHNWSPLKAKTIVVSTRPDACCFAVVDGQGRKLAAEMAGVKYLSCLIVKDLTREQEAALFAGQNDEVAVLSPYDLYTAYLLSGTEGGSKAKAAHDLDKICGMYGIQVRATNYPYTVSTLRCLSTALKIVKNSTEELEWIFQVIQSCGWASLSNGYSQANVLALHNFYCRHQQDLKEATKNLVYGIIDTRLAPDAFRIRAKEQYPASGISVAVGSVMEMVANRHKAMENNEILV